ncbi:MAG TPA: response regulator [Verrucomicrobiae bacterium]|nr:response regulator [Verrucomicrobiae bacterium]
MAKILVIEDEHQMRVNIATILEMEEFDVLCAENGRRGVELALTEKPDLILCDLMMPDIDGEAVLEHLRREPHTARIPFVFLSARGQTAFLKKALPLGPERYLGKPVSAQELLDMIQRHLSANSS